MTAATATEAFQHGRLIHTETLTDQQEGVTVETSLHQSTVTGMYMIRQVVHGKNGNLEASISLNGTLASRFLPFLDRIAKGEAV